MQAGKRYFEQGDLVKAVTAYGAATSLVPGRVEGWVNLGSALFESGHYAVAATTLQKAISMKRELTVAHLLLGDSLRMLGKWREAFACYHNAVALQREPIALNKLACALRTENQPAIAEGLYREALGKDPGFTLARVNLATVQIELRQYAKAEEQLAELAQMPLPSVERREVEGALLCVAEHRRLEQGITALVQQNKTTLLESALRQSTSGTTLLDEGLLESLRRYADSAQRLSVDGIKIDNELPREWPLIEAMFMIPVVDSVDEYQKLKADLHNGLEPDIELRQSINMEAAIVAARDCQRDMTDPVKAELHLRHWHALACREVPGYQAGHFKYTQNWVADNPLLRRVEPPLASATFRHFISEIYCKLPAGYARAAAVRMALSDLHLFADGNGRTTWTWLNRELEWAGLMPAIFPVSRNIKADHTQARREVRASGGDLSPLVDVFIRAQQFAQEFCAELKAK